MKRRSSGMKKVFIDIETYNKVLALLKRQGKTVGRKRIEPLVKIGR